MAKKINWDGKMLSIAKILKQEKISKSTFYRELPKRNNDIEETLLYCMEHKRPELKSEEGKSVIEVAKEENLSPVTIYKHIKGGKTIEEAVQKAKENKQQHFVETGQVEIDGISVFPYCKNMGYNYQIVDHAIRENQMSPEEALETYKREGQSNVLKSYKYQAYGIVLKHLLLYYCLDDSNNLKQFIEKEKLPIEEVMIRKVFAKKELFQKRTRGKKLREIYDLLESCSEEEKEEFASLFNIEQDTIDLLKKKKALIEEIKRDLKYLEFYEMLETCTEEERQEAMSIFGIKEEELDYIKNVLLANFTLVETKHGENVYIKKPNAVSKYSDKLTNR